MRIGRANPLTKVLAGGGSCATDKEGLKARKIIAQGKAIGGRAQAPSDALGQPSNKIPKP